MQRIAEDHRPSLNYTTPLLKAIGQVMYASWLRYPRVFCCRMLVPRKQEENSPRDQPYLDVDDEKSEQED